MGKGVIVEHLGDAHYRIGLDIDVSYARDQLAAIDLYLAEFAAKYQEATDAKNEAQAALAPINARLTEYLADAQAASQAAYDAMVAAYEEWVDAVASQPDPGVLEPLREAMNVWFNGDKDSGDAQDGFITRHDGYVMALDGDEGAPIPDPEEALEARTHALQQLTLAMGDWLGAVGALIDPEAVNAAFDALGIALDDFEAATVAYAAEPGNPTLKSAMNYYQGVYESAHSDWVKAVDDNSGDEYVKAARDAYDAAAETFDNARAALGKLLDNGGMPPELADIMAEQERAYATYHGALQNWQSMTLIKTEKETAKAELMSRLLPFTNNDGQPVRQSVNAWCCDATEDIAVGAEVATIEIPGERDLGVRVRPAYESRETYSAARDGKLQPSWSSSPEATYWNWALHPGNARWNPNYRLGEILFIDPLTDKCTVQLDPQRNNEKSRARDGNTLDVINPVKYQIDPDTGEQTPILPGDNVQVSDGVTTLTDVPIEYMECNAAVFEVGDKVMVEFQGRDWTSPKVIGFAENPKPCNLPGIVLSADINATTEQVFWRERTDSAPVALTHPKNPPLVGGNLDWTSTDGKIRLSFDGPMGRSIPPAISMGYIAPFLFGDQSLYILTNTRGYLDSSTPQALTAGQPFYVIPQRYTSSIYRGGKLIGQVPASEGGQVGQPRGVMGAAVMTYEADEVRKQYVVAVCTVPINSGGFQAHEAALSCKDLALRPECVDHLFFWAELSAGMTAWHLFHTESLSSDPSVMPPVGFYAFSGDGSQFASLVPVMAPLDSAFPGHQDSLIISGSLIADENGVSLASISATHQPASGSYSYSGSKTEEFPYGNDEAYHNFGENNQQKIASGSAIVGIDFIGDAEVTLQATLTRQDNYAQTWDHLDDPLYGGVITRAGNITETRAITATITDTHRSLQMGNVAISSAYSNVKALDVSYNTEPGTGAQSNVVSTELHEFIRRPVYYDLRTGAALYLQAEHDAVTTSVSESTCTIGQVGVADRWQGESTFADDRDFRLTVQDANLVERSAFAWDDSTSTMTAIDYDYSEDNLMDVIGTTPLNESGIWLPESASSTSSVPWIKVRSGPFWLENPLGIYCQPATPSGAIVALAQHPVYLDWADMSSWPVLEDSVSWVFASHVNIDDVWQEHLDTLHPPAEGEETITQTALEADLKPLFRR